MSDILIILLGISLLYVFASSRIEAYIRTLSFQGALLFGLVMFDVRSVSTVNFIMLVFETLVIKAVFIPLLIQWIIHRNEMRHEVGPTIPQFYSTLIATLIFLLGFIAAFEISKTNAGIRSLYFGGSISVIIASLLLIVSRSRIISHILGYLLLENGIFLLSLSIANEMPILVNLGILLDLFSSVFILILFLNKIQEMFDGDHIDSLTQLKD
jgi:hydrogenase-4 component E